jgi:hypothetical protein
MGSDVNAGPSAANLKAQNSMPFDGGGGQRGRKLAHRQRWVEELKRGSDCLVSDG